VGACVLLKYENRHADYPKAWWSIANWEEAARRFERSDLSAQARWEADGGLALADTGVAV
jgi:hypothetical protein